MCHASQDDQSIQSKADGRDCSHSLCHLFQIRECVSSDNLNKRELREKRSWTFVCWDVWWMRNRWQKIDYTLSHLLLNRLRMWGRILDSLSIRHKKKRRCHFVCVKNIICPFSNNKSIALSIRFIIDKSY